MKAFQKLDSIWWVSKDFVKACTKLKGNLCIFHPVAKPQDVPSFVKVGTVVALNLQLLDRDISFSLHARVVEINPPNKPGIRLLCLSDERNRQSLLVKYARGMEVYTKRKHERTPCLIPVNVRSTTLEPVQVWALNISPEGVFISHHEELSGLGMLRMEIDFPGTTSPFLIKAQLKSVVAEGIHPGFGLQFVFSSAENRSELLKLVSELKDVQDNKIRSVIKAVID